MSQEFTLIQLVTEAFAHNYLDGVWSIPLTETPDFSSDGLLCKFATNQFVVTIKITDTERSVAFDLQSKDGKSKLFENIDLDPSSIDKKYSKFPIALSFEDYTKLVELEFIPKFRQHFDPFLKAHVSDYSNVSTYSSDKTPRFAKKSENSISGPDIQGSTGRLQKPIPASLAPPGFEDELEIQGKNSNTNIPGVSTPYGDSDRYPGGLRVPDLDPAAHIRSPGTGGMYPSPDDPLFHPEKRNRNNNLPNPGNGGIRYDDPLAGPHDDLDLAGEGLPPDMGIGKNRKNLRGNFGAFGGGSRFGGGFNGGFNGGFGGGFGGGFM